MTNKTNPIATALQDGNTSLKTKPLVSDSIEISTLKTEVERLVHNTELTIEENTALQTENTRLRDGIEGAIEHFDLAREYGTVNVLRGILETKDEGKKCPDCNDTGSVNNGTERCPCGLPRMDITPAHSPFQPSKLDTPQQDTPDHLTDARKALGRLSLETDVLARINCAGDAIRAVVKCLEVKVELKK